MVNSKYIFPLLSEFDQMLPFTIFTAGRETFTHSIHTYRPNGIPHHQLLFTVQGSASFSFDGKDIMGEPGSLAYHSPYSKHKYKSCSVPWVSYWVTFSLNDPSLLTLKNGIYNFDDISQFTDIISQILKLKNNLL